MGRLMPREQAIQYWEEFSELKADPKALFWWEVFTSVKGMAIWVSQHYVVTTGANTDAVNFYGGLWTYDIQSRILIKQLREGK
jgi:hypothetical protein